MSATSCSFIRSRDRFLLPVLAILAAFAASCARHLPTAPTALSGAERDPAPRVSPMRAASAEDEVVATLAPGTDAAAVATSYGATLIEDQDWGCARFSPGAGETPDALVLRMAGDPRLITSERNATLEPAETRAQEPYAADDGHGSPDTYANQPATGAIRLAYAHLWSRGDGVRVAILDTGAELGHPAFAGRIVEGWDFIGKDAVPADAPDGLDNDADGRVDEAVGHGTHVAGIVALTAPRSQLLIARVLDSDGRGDVMSVASGIRWALSHGARVINLSLGMLKNSDAIQYLLEGAESQGVVVVASAGNWGAEDPREFPSTSSHALGIAAVNAQAEPASFTSFGDHIALCAPGVGVRSAFPGGGYWVWSGTSMSTPFVAGTAALLLARHPEWGVTQVLDRLDQTARPLSGASPAQQGKLGSGALDAGAALAPDRRGTSFPPDPAEPETPLLRRP